MSEKNTSTSEGFQVETRVPSLDGWRALSITLVIFGHFVESAKSDYGLPSLLVSVFNGNIGVRIFFIISGFLITLLLIKEMKKQGTINLIRFYARRSLRILPVYFAFLICIAILQNRTVFSQSREDWIANLTFTTGLYSHGGQNWTTGHLWSLAVEEQFYLVYPLLLTSLWGRGQNRLFMTCLFFTVLMASVCRIIGYLDIAPYGTRFLFSQYTIFCNADSLAIGCMSGILFTQKGEAAPFVISKPYCDLLPCISLVLVLAVSLMRHCLVMGWLTVPFGDFVQGIGISMLILQSIVFFDKGIYRVLNWRFVSYVGVISYSLYIWQQLFCTKPEAFGWQEAWFLEMPGSLVATFLISLVSFYVLETPFLKIRAYLR